MIATLVRITILTVLWAALQGSFSVGNLLLGVVLSTAVVLFSRPLFDAADPAEQAGLSTQIRPVRRLGRCIVLLIVFLRELIESSLRVAIAILKPTLQVRSGIIAYPLDVKTDREITALANLITLTPGTLSLDVSDDRQHIFVHAMSVETESGDEVIADIKRSLEKHVHRALGPRPGASA
jgi:multicomponent Na+:H+ antiporter subunit E